jgi:hypothetical protein
LAKLERDGYLELVPNRRGALLVRLLIADSGVMER